jgi:hypothetical protein
MNILLLESAYELPAYAPTKTLSLEPRFVKLDPVSSPMNTFLLAVLSKENPDLLPKIIFPLLPLYPNVKPVLIFSPPIVYNHDNHNHYQPQW